MRKIIKIFLGSSIVEFANERMAIENFIRNISDKFEENYDIKIQPLLCENLDDAYSKIRKQEIINENVRNSELCFFIFFTKTGKYTKEEFEVARKKFEEMGKPKIYTYFKVIKDETAEQSLYDFMNELDKTFGHYYGTFEHIDTVKLRILLNLKLQEMDFLEIKVDGDACVVDGKKTLSLENVSEFANNSIFQELKAELYEVEESYFNLKAKYEKDECSPSEEREYIEIATKRQNLIDSIEEIQKNIFNMSLRMCQDEARGEITIRQKEAYRLFEAGDLEGANNILDFTEIEKDYLRDIAIIEANIKKRSEVFIRETKTKIDILATMIKLYTRFTEIEELYDKIVAVVFKYNIEIDTLFYYVEFLYEQNQYQKAYEIGKRLEVLVSDSTDDEKKARLYGWLGLICSDLVGKKTEAEEYYKKTITIIESLVVTNPQLFNFYLATNCNNAGIFYKNHGQVKKAEMYCKKALVIFEELVAVNPEMFSYDLANVYNNTGLLYVEQEQPEKAEKYYKKAISIREKLVEISPKRYNATLAMSYNNAGIFYEKQGQPRKAEEYYKKAISISEELAITNPEIFNPALATSYNNIGIFYHNQGEDEKAEAYYKKAITIREKLAESNPEMFNPDLADSYNNVALFFDAHGQSKKAEEYYKKALAIYEKLAESNAERFNPYLATSYNNVGVFYSKQGEKEKAEEYYKKAISIREKLAGSNPEKFTPDLADVYDNTGLLYVEQGQSKKAEKYYKKAISIREKLVELSPESYSADLAMSYNNAGNFYENQGDSRIAEDYHKKAIAIREMLAESNPERFNSNLAISYNNIGISYHHQGKKEKAEEYYKKAITIREKLAESNPEIFNSDLADSYNNIGAFYYNQGQQEKAKKYLKQAIELYKKLAESNFERFNPVLAVGYFNYAIFSQEEIWLEKALVLAKTMPDNSYCKQIIDALKDKLEV